MLILVTADNFIQMFVGWEGVGLCSYLLISFWFTRIQANKAAIKAMLVNRIGDFGLALGIFGIYITFHSVDYATVFASIPLILGKNFLFLGFDLDVLTVCSLFLFIGAIGKSAQIKRNKLQTVKTSKSKPKNKKFLPKIKGIDAKTVA
jgi:NADH-quinone oxidoreductase subunit L